ncbi:MAG: hypothetical protein ACYC0L_07710 [Thermoleophilia bacterium]
MLDLKLIDLERIANGWIAIHATSSKDLVIMNCHNNVLRNDGAVKNGLVQIGVLLNVLEESMTIRDFADLWQSHAATFIPKSLTIAPKCFAIRCEPPNAAG